MQFRKKQKNKKLHFIIENNTMLEFISEIRSIAFEIIRPDIKLWKIY